MNPYQTCLYTIRSKTQLDKVVDKGTTFAFTINMLWTKAKTEFEKATQNGKDYIALFSDALQTDKIYHIGVVASIEVSKTTTIEFSQIMRIENEILKTDLIKLSGSNISKNFIRPYSLCKTPDFNLFSKLNVISLSTSKNGDEIYEKVESFLMNNILNEMELTFLALLKERGNLGLSSIETRELFGFKHIIQANRLISQIGKKYLKYAGIDFSNIRNLYEIVSDPGKNHRDENGFFKWVLREPFSKNVDSVISKIDSFATFYFIEGRRTKVENTYYERNIKAREKCIEHYGFICKICGFDFSKAYGEIGKGYIEVHHLVPIHEKKIEYHVNPINDLIPVCSNCHSIIHRKNPPYNEEEIKMQLGANLSTSL